MAADTLEEQLVKYLTDAHSIEEQALAQMRSAPGLASDPGLSEAFRSHEAETERHEQLVRSRLEAHDASPSRLKDAVMAVGGKGFVLFARSQPDTDGKLATHALSYEHLELASYELLSRVADRAGDEETAAVAREIRDEEQAMASRLEAAFDGSVSASLDKHPRSDLDTLVDKYLGDAHALETQSEQLLSRAPEIGGSDPELVQLYEDHLEETRGHKRLRAPGDRRLRAPAPCGPASGGRRDRRASGAHPAPGARSGPALRSELGPRGRRLARGTRARLASVARR
jgi:ferritin-like metal-binding protein YciE